MQGPYDCEITIELSFFAKIQNACYDVVFLCAIKYICLNQLPTLNKVPLVLGFTNTLEVLAFLDIFSLSVDLKMKILVLFLENFSLELFGAVVVSHVSQSQTILHFLKIELPLHHQH